LFPEGYLDHAALTAALRRLVASSAGKAHLQSLARTQEGRDVWLVSVSEPSKAVSDKGADQPASAPPSAPSNRPAILIVANLEADHVVGSQVALAILEQVTRDPAWEKRLARCTLHVVPRLNPDGAERLFHRLRADVRTNLTPLDRDHDGRSGEDGPEDLNGDGLIGRMRVKDGKATLIPDPADPRLLRKADPAKGERPVYSEYAEGIDNDGDGEINEDPPGGVNLNRNWPYRWAEFDPEAGFSPVAEPETRALVEFAFDHPEIALVWSFGLNDNLLVAPKKPEAFQDAADLPIFAELSRLHAKVASAARREPDKKPAASTAPAGSPASESKPEKPPETAPASPGATTDGALSEWAYQQLGVIGLASRLWQGPELPQPESGEAKKDSSASAQPKIPGDGEARWLYWNDWVMGGRAFVPFAPFNHRTLGKVEIGGWKPGVRFNPPIEQVGPIAKANGAFLEELASRLPHLAIRDVKVEAKGKRIYQVTASVVNEGEFPTALVQGTRSRKAPPVRVRLEVGAGRLLAGPARSHLDALGGSGGRREFRWLVLAPEDTGAKPFAVTLSASTPKAGTAVQTIPIAAAR
jgi:hypothetical protein